MEDGSSVVAAMVLSKSSQGVERTVTCLYAFDHVSSCDTLQIRLIITQYIFLDPRPAQYTLMMGFLQLPFEQLGRHPVVPLRMRLRQPTLFLVFS